MKVRDIWIFVAVLGVSAYAQPSKPQFEVASIKTVVPVTSGAFNTLLNAVIPRIWSDRFAAGQVTVQQLLMLAYGLEPYRIVGGPDWLQLDSFAVNAKAGTDVPVDQIKLMIQSLLEDRFKLVTHNERREMRYQALVLARATKGLGPALFRIDVQCTSAMVNELRRKFPEKYVTPSGNGVMSTCSAAGVETLAAVLTTRLGTTVIDGTRLEGPFYFALSAQLPPLGSSLGAPKSDPSDLPALSTALEGQLGLKLESRKGPVKVLVIDSVSRPTEN